MEPRRAFGQLEHLNADDLVTLVEIKNDPRRHFVRLKNRRLIETQVESIGFFIDLKFYNSPFMLRQRVVVNQGMMHHPAAHGNASAKNPLDRQRRGGDAEVDGRQLCRSRKADLRTRSKSAGDVSTVTRSCVFASTFKNNTPRL